MNKKSNINDVNNIFQKFYQSFKMTDYKLMYQTSPVQKDCEVKLGDKIESLSYSGICLCIESDEARILWYGFIDEKGIWNNCTRQSIYKILRQEDWQEIYMQKKRAYYLDVTHDKLFELIGQVKDTDEGLISEYTILWCLFVHKEVFGLVWSWEEKKWKTQK